MTENSQHIEVISERTQFLDLEKEWDSTYRQDPDAEIFLSWQWLKDLFSRRDEAIYILAYRESESSGYQAFFPLRKKVYYSNRRNCFYNGLSMAGNDWADYTGILCHPAYEDQAIDAFSNYLRDANWDRLSLGCLKISENRFARFISNFESKDYALKERRSLDNGGETNLAVCPRIRLPDTFESYLGECVNSGSRQRIRRTQRKFESDPSLSISQSTIDTVASDLDLFAKYWCERFRPIKGIRSYTLADNYRNILEQGYATGHMELATFKKDGQTIAVHANYVDRVKGNVLFFVGSRSQANNHLSAGLLLHIYSIGRAIDNNFAHYDFLRGDEPYKYSLGGTDVPLINIELRRRSTQQASRFVEQDCLNQAIAAIRSLKKRKSITATETLFAQLLESWPTESRVLKEYADWLRVNGQAREADAIAQTLS